MPRYANKKTRQSLPPTHRKRPKGDQVARPIEHYDTLVLQNPTIQQRGFLNTVNHIWRFGDRYYNLANHYYGTSQYWWVIAWYNGRPTEADISTGDILSIPLNLEEALRILGAY